MYRQSKFFISETVQHMRALRFTNFRRSPAPPSGWRIMRNYRLRVVQRRDNGLGLFLRDVYLLTSRLFNFVELRAPRCWPMDDSIPINRRWFDRLILTKSIFQSTFDERHSPPPDDIFIHRKKLTSAWPNRSTQCARFSRVATNFIIFIFNVKARLGEPLTFHRLIVTRDFLSSHPIKLTDRI